MSPSANRFAAGLQNDKKTLLTVQELSKTFTVNGTGMEALSNINLTVSQGEMICLVGRSGCGKTTLLNLIAGFKTPTAGTILVKGQPISGPGTDRCVVFQEDALFPWLTVEENIAFGLRGGKKEVREKVARYLSLVGLDAFARHLPREISGGMKQRVALARVLILEPLVLLMDEPFGALDAQTRAAMQDLLLDLWHRLGHTIVFVTHDVREAVTLADRVLLMDTGPGRIREDIPVSLPRPRSADTQAFIDLNRQLLEKLGLHGR